MMQWKISWMRKQPRENGMTGQELDLKNEVQPQPDYFLIHLF